MWKVYKEGQGKWARGLLVAVIMLGAILALIQLHGSLPALRSPQDAIDIGLTRYELVLPAVGWVLDYRYLVHAPLLIAAAVFSLWLFNRSATADFLIDTESELKSKVTWPSRKEEVNASMVVVVMVLILSVFIFCVDWLFQQVNGWIYGT